MNPKIILIRPLAESDLESIYTYSFHEFGLDRAIEYIQDLDIAFNKLADNQSLGRKCDAIKSGLLAFNVVSHIIFFRVTKKEIIIVRVLHKTMDYGSHL